MATSRAVEAGLARRAQIVLLAADGLPHTEVAKPSGSSQGGSSPGGCAKAGTQRDQRLACSEGLD